MLALRVNQKMNQFACVVKNGKEIYCNWMQFERKEYILRCQIYMSDPGM